MRAKLMWPTDPQEIPRSAILIYGLFLAAGLALLIALLLLPLYRSYMARSWRDVPCIILSSKVDSIGAINGITFKIAIAYSYVVNGHEYTGHRYDFFSHATAGYRSKADIVRQYAPGTQRHCLVNPADPAQSVLTRQLRGPPLWIGFLPLLFVVAGAWGIIQAVRQRIGNPAPRGNRIRLQWRTRG